jgi:hypothetical protein
MFVQLNTKGIMLSTPLGGWIYNIKLIEELNVPDTRCGIYLFKFESTYPKDALQ